MRYYKYYYKTKDGKGFLSLLQPREDENYIEITEDEFRKLAAQKKVELTDEQIVEKEKQKKIREYKQYLTDTDYIVLKISEALAYGDAEEVENLKTTYSEQLAKRKECRELLNELE